MKAKILSVLLITLVLSNASWAQQASPEENQKFVSALAQIDGEHSKEQFESIINVLHQWYPNDYEYWRKAYAILTMYDSVKKQIPDLKLYSFALGFKEFILDSGTNMTFQQSLAVYSASVYSGF